MADDRTLQALTVRILPEQMDALKNLSVRTGDSLNDLIAQSITFLLQDDRDYAASVEEGLADIEAGRTFAHEDVMHELYEIVARAALKRA